LGPGEVEHRRHAAELGHLVEADLHQHAHLVVAQPFGVERLQRVPADAAPTVDLAALHRDMDLGCRLIALHDLELHAVQKIEDVGVDRTGRGGAARADHHAARAHVFNGAYGRAVPGHADIGLGVGVAEPGDLLDVEARLAHPRLERVAALDEGNGGAHPGGHHDYEADEAARAPARHVLHHDGGISVPMPA